MTRSSVPRWLVPFVLVLFACLVLPACSGDENGPTGPDDDDPLPANTPPIPEVSNPNDELPPRSEFLTTETAPLRNFSPTLAGLSQEMLDRLNEAHTLDFQLPPSRNVIFQDGRACHPERLQTKADGGSWVNLSRSSAVEPFVALGAYEGSHYYLSTTPAIWAFADANCRNFGGHLAAITSSAENVHVLGAVQAEAPGAIYWIGLTDWWRANNDWIWTSGEALDWTNWNPGEPNNSHGEYFTEVLTNGLWNDSRYQTSRRYVLELSEPLPDFGEDPVACAAHGQNLLFLDALALPSVAPYVERRVYWAKVFQVTLGAGATYGEEHSYTHGTSETTGMSFGYSIGISTEAGWGPVSVAIETEFHQDFQHEVTVSSEETFSKTYEATAPAGETMVLALWQLRERYVITDGSGEAWSDPDFLLDGPLPELDQGLQQEYLQTILFEQ